MNGNLLSPLYRTETYIHYHHRFYVNVHTKQSQWEKPTEPVYPTDHTAPPGPPPGYAPGERTYPSGASAGDSAHHGYPQEKLGTNNPYSHGPASGSAQNIDEDARLAARLQAEEDARVAGRPTNSGDRGESDSYYGGGTAPSGVPGGVPGGMSGQQPPYQSYDQQQLPPREKEKKGGLGGLLSKIGGKHSSGQPHGYGGGQYGGQPQYAQQGGYPPQGGYGGYPQQSGYPSHGGYGSGYGGGHPPKKAGGIGTAGGAALGLGGGLLGGAMLANAFDGGDGGGDGGGDYGGGDYGGGDDGGGGDYGGGGGDGGGGGGD